MRWFGVRSQACTIPGCTPESWSVGGGCVSRRGRALGADGIGRCRPAMLCAHFAMMSVLSTFSTGWPTSARAADPRSPEAKIPLVTEAKPAGVGDEQPGSPLFVRYEDNKLTVNCEDAPVRAVLERLGVQSGAKIDMDRLQDHRITTSFQSLPLQEALTRLLPNHNFLATYSAIPKREGNSVTIASHLAHLEITGPAGQATKQAPVVQASDDVLSTDELGTATALYQSLLMTPMDLHGEPALAAALGKDTPSVNEVFRAAFRHQDEPIRREAGGALARVLEAQAGEITLPADPEAIMQMAGVLRSAAGPHAEEFIGVLANSFQNRKLRDQAIAIRDALHH